MAADEELLVDLTEVVATERLLVACGFDGALAFPTSDPLDARAEQQSSEALNVLLALAGVSVAVVSRRPRDEVAELMFLSGSKGGAHLVTPDDLPRLRKELDVTGLVLVDADPESFGALRDDDLGVSVGPAPEDGAGLPSRARHRVDDADTVIDVVEELARLRRS